MVRLHTYRARTMTTHNKTIGAYGEKAVADFLILRGATIIDRNWRIKEGEIDLVALMPTGVIAFVEVKTRRSYAFGHPLDSITSDKALRLQRLALAWLVTHNSFGREYHIDCAAVLVAENGSHAIEYRAEVL